jgi:hypothetical protein
MAAQRVPLGAHDRHHPRFAQRFELREAAVKARIGCQALVKGVSRFSRERQHKATTKKVTQPPILDPLSAQRPLQGLPVKLNSVTTVRAGSHVHETGDVSGVQEVQKTLERMARVANGIK